ncbi:MAG: UDP-N-acetylmuramoyl-L-alanine--D-glutamate ligase, partial [Desulfuromonas sp.]
MCRFFVAQQARVILSDNAEIIDRAGIETLPIKFDLGGHNTDLFCKSDLIVLSPGVPESIAAVQVAKQKGVPVIGEVEVEIRELAAPMIGITGTNGKSTVTTLTGEIFQAAGKKTYIGGNIGEPMTDAVEAGAWDWVVIELSSFQLESMQSFKPRYSMLLNISPDHLDRYPDMAAYIDAKKRLLMNQDETDFTIVNIDDPEVMKVVASGRGQLIPFSCQQRLDEGMSCQDKEITWRWQGKEIQFPVDELQIKGLHNVANVMAAMVPALIEGVDAQTIWRAVCDFTGLPHRMNLVRMLDGVAWYDDSKGTNVGSVVMSLTGLDKPVTLIAGGKDKGGDFGLLRTAVAEKVTTLILIGEAAVRIEKEIGPVTEIIQAETLA